MDEFDNPLDPSTGWAREHVHRYVETDGADPTNGHDWREGATVLLLTTIGQRSKRARRTPLIYGRDGADYLIVASLGGSDEPPQWLGNIEADSRVRIQVRGDVMDGRARVATPAEKQRLWPTMTAIWHHYDAYQRKTERDIPIVVIETTN